jgi:multicomponent Na+:H+ antiporter subunit B
MVRRHFILRVVSKLLMPFILLFALYVQFHGDFGPGGGFQAGVIFGAAFILYAMIFGVEAARRVAPDGLIRLLIAAGLMLYVGVGYVGMFLGSEFLDYNVLAHDPVHGQHLGISLVEFGVGTTVAATMITIFFTFAGRKQS